MPNRQNKHAGGKILKNIKRAGQNKRAGGNFFSKSINVQTKIRPCRGIFCLKINQSTLGLFWDCFGNALAMLWNTLGMH